MKRKKLIKLLKKEIKNCVSIPFYSVNNYIGWNIRFDNISIVDEKDKLYIMSHNIRFEIKKEKLIKLKKYILKHYRLKNDISIHAKT